uniref:Uncharacterized protein n=1 Tax=Tetranychus urticae TaxID=32264 RepID=T1KMC6_TETUR
MQKVNLTVGAFSVPFAEGFVEEDDQFVPNLKSLKRFAAILTDYGPFNLKFILPEEGQLGVLTETGYHDGVLGLMQDGKKMLRFHWHHKPTTVNLLKLSRRVERNPQLNQSFSALCKADMCFVPLPLDTQKAPGYFTSVTSEMDYYILTQCDIIGGLTVLEIIAVKHFKIDALLAATFRSFGISFHQHSSNHSSWFCLIQILILMFPVFIFNSAFSTQTIIGTSDYKVDTLQDVIEQGKIPCFFEGISLYDFFKGKVNKDYAEIYERAIAKGHGEPMPLGPIADRGRLDKLVTFVSGIGRKLTPLSAAESNLIVPNQVQYFSEKPFHRSLQAMLFNHNTSESLKKRFDTLSRRMIQSGISKKLEGDTYVDFILSFYPATLYDFHKSQVPQKGDDLNWQPVNYRGFYQIFLEHSSVYLSCVWFLELQFPSDNYKTKDLPSPIYL